MSQSKKESAVEAITNTLFGMGLAYGAQLFWFPVLGKEFTTLENIYTVLFFTGVSFFRNYIVRRFFNPDDMPTDEKLFHKILEKGCEDCGNNFSVVSSSPSQIMLLECDECFKQYRVDPMLQQAERL